MAIDWEEEDELEALIRRLSPRLEAILRRFRIPPQDSQDRIQNVTVQYIFKRSQIRNPDAWLVGALRRECLMYLRTARRSRMVAVDSPLLEVISEPLVPDAEREVMKAGLGGLIAKLPWKCQNLLRLKFVEGLNADEIAERTGYKRSSVDKVVRRCLSALKRKIDAAAIAIAKRRKRDKS